MSKAIYMIADGLMEFEGWTHVSIWGTTDVEGTLNEMCLDVIERNPGHRYIGKAYHCNDDGNCYDFFKLCLADDPELVNLSKYGMDEHIWWTDDSLDVFRAERSLN